MSDLCIHPFNSRYPIPADTQWLIIGAAPPPRFETKQLRTDDVDFFYGSADNQLWKDILSSVYNEDFSAGTAEERFRKMESALRQHRHWMVDILTAYTRRVQDSVCEADLKPETFLDLKEVFSKLPDLRGLLLTSSKVTVWVGQALRRQGLLRKGQYRRMLVFNSPVERRILNVNLPSVVRTIEAITLPSPARTSNRRMPMSLPEKIDVYRHCLGSAEK